MHLGNIVVPCGFNLMSVGLDTGTYENRTDEPPTILLDVVKINRVTREGVTMAGGIDAPPSHFLGIFV